MRASFHEFIEFQTTSNDMRESDSFRKLGCERRVIVAEGTDIFRGMPFGILKVF